MNFDLIKIEELEHLLSLGLEISYQNRIFIKSVNFEWVVDYEYFNPHADPKTIKQRKFFNNLAETVKFFLEQLLEINDELGLISGGPPIYGDHKKSKMKIRDLLTKNIAYVKDIKEIESTPNHVDSNWDVYKNVKRMQQRFESNREIINRLPPVQLYNDSIIDGAHRLNALLLMSQSDSSILDLELDIENYSRIHRGTVGYKQNLQEEHPLDCPWWKDYHACSCGAFDLK